VVQIAPAFIFHVGEWPWRTPQPQHTIATARSASQELGQGMACWDVRCPGLSLCWKAGWAQGQPVVSTPWLALLTASALSCQSLTAHQLRCWILKHLDT